MIGPAGYKPHSSAIAAPGRRRSTGVMKNPRLARQLDRIAELIDRDHLNEADAKARTFTTKHGKVFEGWQLLGRICIRQQAWQDAAWALTTAHRLAPKEISTLINLSLAHYHLDNYHTAADYAQRAVEGDPGNARALNNLGMALIKQEAYDDAIDVLTRALAVQPELAPALSNLGAALNRTGRFEDALDVLGAAVKLDPSNAFTLVNIGISLRHLQRKNDAVAMFQQALAINPNTREAVINIAQVLNGDRKHTQSLRLLTDLIHRHPRYAQAHFECAITLTHLGQLEEARRAAETACENDPNHPPSHALLITADAGSEAFDKDTYLKRTRTYSALFDRRRSQVLGQAPADDARLRIGFIGGDFRRHPVGFFLKSLFQHYDRTNMDFHVYHNNIDKDDLTSYFIETSSSFKNLHNKNDKQKAFDIAKDRLHILIDMAGFTSHNCLGAMIYKPAPIQMTWVGYFASTGLPEIDYVLADPYVVPNGCEAEFSEQVLRFPDSYLCFSEPDDDVPFHPPNGSGPVTFGSFNNLNKVSDTVIGLWARVLRAVPESRLLLKTTLLGSAEHRDRIRQRFIEQGIADYRLILEGPSPRKDLLNAYNRIDIALDPFPYGGGTTTAEALWMGVPVLTKRGDRFLPRIANSMLTNIGLPQWIADDDDDYVRKAVAYTADRKSLAALRAGLRQEVLISPLFDGPAFAKAFHHLMRFAWNRYLQTASTATATVGGPR